MNRRQLRRHGMKILSHFAHGTYQTALSRISNIEFYHVEDATGIWPEEKRPKKAWPDIDSKPGNVYAIDVVDVNPTDYDAVLIHWHPFIETFSERWRKHLPVIFTEHTWPYNNLNSEIYRWKQTRAVHCEHTVFITPSSKDAWCETNNPQASYIYHAIGTDDFPQKDNFEGKQIMTTTNEFISRDWACGFSLWSKVLGVPGTAFFDDIALYGYGNKNIGPISKGPRTREEILTLLCNAGLYFNPSIMSPVPMSLLEAAAVGTPIVSTAHCEPGRIFKNGEHGIITNNPVELREGIRSILKDSEDAKRMAKNAHRVVRATFNPAMFQEEWKNLFNKVIKAGRIKRHERRNQSTPVK